MRSEILKLVFVLLSWALISPSASGQWDSCWCEGTLHFYNPNKGHVPISTNIFDDNYQHSFLDSPDDYRAQIFYCPNDYAITMVRLKIQRIGYLLGQDLIVEIRAVNENNVPTGPVLCWGYKDFSDVFIADEGAWYPINMHKQILQGGSYYAIIVRLDIADADNKLVWYTNQEGVDYGYAIWTNNGARETGPWQGNNNADRLYEIWGHIQ